MNDSLDLPNVTDEQALGGPAIRLADHSDDTLEIGAGRVGKFGPGWTEAAHSADAWPSETSSAPEIFHVGSKRLDISRPFPSLFTRAVVSPPP